MYPECSLIRHRVLREPIPDHVGSFHFISTFADNPFWQVANTAGPDMTRAFNRVERDAGVTITR
jgi:hypothetical protein